MRLNQLLTFQRSAGVQDIRENIFRKQAPRHGLRLYKNRMTECICVFLRTHNRDIACMFYLRGNLLLRTLPVLHCAIYSRSRGTFSFRQHVSQLIRFHFRILDNSCHLLEKSYNQRVNADCANCRATGYPCR
jgi:hypothetical protein